LKTADKKRNIIITGIPRSGTTLAAAMIDECANAICLSEPNSHVELMYKSESAEAYVSVLVGEFSRLRYHLLAGGTVSDRRGANGNVLTNYLGPPDQDGKRCKQFSEIERGKSNLAPDFMLASKHNALYAAVLPALVAEDKFRVLAVIRDPVAVIQSWNSVDLPISRGRLPAADKFWPEMHQLGTSDMDLLDKHILIYELFCQRFMSLLPRLTVVRYEDFVDHAEILYELVGLNLQPHDIPRLSVERMPAVETPVLKRRLACLASQKKISAALNFYPKCCSY
jgi:hypothetical protein